MTTKYCAVCGAPTAHIFPPDDNVLRDVCTACDHIHYVNPKIIGVTLPTWEDHVLLCKRAIEPRLGLWTLPGGFMECHESLEEAARRETWEEACSQLQEVHLFAIYSIPHISQVYTVFRGEMKSPEHAAGPESLETALIKEDDIPWAQIAFPVMTRLLKEHYAGSTAPIVDTIDRREEYGVALPPQYS